MTNQAKLFQHIFKDVIFLFYRDNANNTVTKPQYPNRKSEEHCGFQNAEKLGKRIISRTSEH